MKLDTYLERSVYVLMHIQVSYTKMKDNRIIVDMKVKKAMIC